MDLLSLEIVLRDPYVALSWFFDDHVFNLLKFFEDRLPTGC
jgi:hypothetical protein